MAAPTVSSVTPANGPISGGTPVTIVGTGFVLGATVAFSGTQATGVSVVSSTMITCVSPAALVAGMQNVVVTDTGGTSAINGGDQYTFLSVPTVTSVTPNRSVQSGGQNVTINGTNFLGATQVNFGIVPVYSGVQSGGFPGGAGFAINATGTQIYATTPPQLATGTFDVTVITPAGTSATSTADQVIYQTPGYFNTVADVVNYCSNNVIKKTLNYSDAIPWINDCMQMELLDDACLFNNWVVQNATYNTGYAVPQDFIKVYAVYDSNGDDFYDFQCDSAYFWFDYGASLFTIRYYQVPPIVSNMSGTDPLPCHPLIANAIPYYLAYRFSSVDYPNDKDTSQRYAEFKSKVQFALDRMPKRFNRKIRVSTFR